MANNPGTSVYEHGQSSGSFPGSGSFKLPDQPKIDIGRRIFCNRAVNMGSIVAVGFNMGYTLARYKPEFELLAQNEISRKLVKHLNYPHEMLTWKFNQNSFLRGLVLDKKRGNILKMDRHKYVKVAYHGYKELSKEEKAEIYGNTLVHNSFDGLDYALLDTVSSIKEAWLWAGLVDFKDNFLTKIPLSWDYARMYEDVRTAADLCHRDRTLEQKIATDPSRYIMEDTLIVPMLNALRDSGHNTFLVTNSSWDYTCIVMNFLCGSVEMSGSTKLCWLKYFDVVITGSEKPSFFHEGNRAKMFEVELETGKLLNTDDGFPVPQVGNISAGSQIEDRSHACRVFQGGSASHLHKLLSIKSSSQVLYVGDHIHEDVLCSKKVLGWRTMLVIPELEWEVKILTELKPSRQELMLLRSKSEFLEDYMDYVNQLMELTKPDDDTRQKMNTQISNLELERMKVISSHRAALKKYHLEFHNPWGQLMKTGYQNSLFCHQVQRFACLYTSYACNLVMYSPKKCFRPSEDFVDHEFALFVNRTE